MRKEYRIKDMPVRVPSIIGKLIARASGRAYVDGGAFYDPTGGEAADVLVNKDNKRSFEGILALIGDKRRDVKITGDSVYVGEADMHYAVNREMAKPARRAA